MLSSKQNPKIKAAQKLFKRRERDEQGLFLIEGYRELSRARSQPLEMIFYCEELFLGENEHALIASFNVPTFACSASVFRSLSYRDRPDGLLAVAKKVPLTLEELPEKKSPLYVVAEAIEKPGNLGTILRSSDAAGADGVLVCDRCTDMYNPNVVRASVGTLFTVPCLETDGEQTLAWLHQQKIAIVAATPSAEQVYTEVDLTGPIAIAVGTEQYGLSKRWMGEADLHVRIPMQGVADSLNVAMATTLLLFEAQRQRGL